MKVKFWLSLIFISCLGMLAFDFFQHSQFMSNCVGCGMAPDGKTRLTQEFSEKEFTLAFVLKAVSGAVILRTGVWIFAFLGKCVKK